MSASTTAVEPSRTISGSARRARPTSWVRQVGSAACEPGEHDRLGPGYWLVRDRRCRAGHRAIRSRESRTQNRLLPPSSTNWFGTDDGGRDIFSRVVFGARYSLLAAAVVLLLAVTFGTAVGLIAGFAGGKIDEALMRLTDMFLAFPHSSWPWGFQRRWAQVSPTR